MEAPLIVMDGQMHSSASVVFSTFTNTPLDRDGLYDTLCQNELSTDPLSVSLTRYLLVVG